MFKRDWVMNVDLDIFALIIFMKIIRDLYGNVLLFIVPFSGTLLPKPKVELR